MSKDFTVKFTVFEKECMSKALEQAKKAFDLEEVPVGAVIAFKDQIIATAFNQIESKKDVTRHAELRCIQKASKLLDRWRLEGCTLYVTLEPCLMCLGAIINARISRLIWAVGQTRRSESLEIKELAKATANLGPQLEIASGLMECEAKELIQTFFKKRRKECKKKESKRFLVN